MRIKDSFFLLVLIILNILYFPDISYSMGKRQSGFVDIREIIPQIELDIRYYGSHNFLGERVDGYLAPKCILTKEAAQALLN
ncbi:MAG TPA: M15 family metallopeptidase, partial [Smithellaceae bacterium]|nr:M15 family metallopeptidase [Smithellaceae bacterium]